MNNSEPSDELPDPASDVAFIGPVSRTHILVTGREVPYLTGQEILGGKIRLCLDDRFGVEIPAELTEQFVPFVAHAIAVGMGYTHHPEADEEPHRAQPFRRWAGILGVES